MHQFFKFLLFSFCFTRVAANAQTNVLHQLQIANPVNNEPEISLPAKLKIHEAYLQKAIAEKNINQQFYGLLFLYDDQVDMHDYPAAKKYAIEAEKIARNSGNKSFEGYVKTKSGWIDQLVQQDIPVALKKYEEGASLCIQAKDTLCTAECWAQMSSAYGKLMNFEKAKYYFNLAIPILRRYEDSHLGSAYNNFANLFAYQDRSAEALPYIDSAISISRQQKNTRAETVYLTNKGLFLYEVKRYDEAIALLNTCIAINEKNKWLDNLVYDYGGMAAACYETGSFKAAYDYLEKYRDLKDTLASTSIKLKIAGLTVQNEVQEKELALKKSQLALLTAKSTIQKRTSVIFIVLLVLIFILSLWVAQQKKEKRKQAHTLANLEQLTRILIEKNSLLAELEEKLLVQQPGLPEQVPVIAEVGAENHIKQPEAPNNKETSSIESQPDNLEINVYNQRILTPSDWSAFKIYFEKAYPGYLLRLRNSFPLITEAEERIFLFAKLSLTNKEAAAILGISADSVKKTRLRLRKRLELDDKTELDKFVKSF